MVEAKREALRLVQVAEDAKKAAIMMMNDERDAAARAESQRLAELKLNGSDHVYKKALEAIAGDTSRARYIISDLTEAPSKNMVAIHRLNIALRKSITKSLCYLADMAMNKLNKVTFSSTGKSTPPPGLTKCTATPVPTRRYSEVAGIKATTAAQSSSNGTPDCHATYEERRGWETGLGSTVQNITRRNNVRGEKRQPARGTRPRTGTRPRGRTRSSP